MPQLTPREQKELNRLSNKIFDTLRNEFELSEDQAAKIAEKACKIIREGAEGKL